MYRYEYVYNITWCRSYRTYEYTQAKQTFKEDHFVLVRVLRHRGTISS